MQFDRLSAAKNAHFGAFWKTLEADQWPTVTDATPVPTQIEQFGAKARWGRGVQVQFTQDPAFRLQIRSADDERMIQVQNTRLHFNWLGKGGEEYPRYERVREGFVSALERFTQFVTDESLGDFRPNQWEVTYINHIPRGIIWKTPADWAFFRPLTGVPTVEGVIEGESFAGEWHFTIPGQRGRLHVAWQHAEETGDGEGADASDFIRLTLTARGPVGDDGEGIQPILDGLDLGRETIVRSFGSFMSDQANHLWGLKDGN